MKIFIVLSTLVVLLSGCWSCKIKPDFQVFQNLANSSVLISVETKEEGGGGTGSGVVIRANSEYSLILTAAHVVDEEDIISIEITASRGDTTWTMPASRLASNILSDLAILKVDGKLGLPAVMIADNEPQLYERLFSVSAPLHMIGTAADQILVDKDALFNGRRGVWRIQGFIAPGSSGGPVVNRNGQLVCIQEGIKVSPVRAILRTDEGENIELPILVPVPVHPMGFCVSLFNIRNMLNFTF